jgi:signal transduction histidine kinase
MFSEFQRLEESKASSKKLLTAIAIALALGLFGTVSIILTRKFQKQSQQLAKANAEVKRVNEHLEELVSERTAQLSETNQELDTFLYKSSHDLRRPLTSIVGLSNIASLTLKGDAYELFERAADTARNMDRMLRKLINVNEINNPSQYCQIDFSSQVQKATDAFEDLIKDRNIEVSTNIQHGIEYNSYPSLIEIILQNLIENALFFSSLSKSVQRPAVKVNVIKQNGHIAINLEDNGCGIDPAVKDNIWNMFFVGHERSTGNGLGLYITKKAVRTLQGEVACISGNEGATIFEVRLPVNGRC